MDRASAFSYACNACGLCCRDQVVPLSPYDLLQIARAAGITTGAAVRYFTIRRGSILKFSGVNHSCVALLDSRCSLHPGRPLACRLYPLGLEHDRGGDGQRFVQLTPAAGSAGVYGAGGTVETFLAAQGVDEYLGAVARYATLLPVMRAQIAALVDFDQVRAARILADRDSRGERRIRLRSKSADRRVVRSRFARMWQRRLRTDRRCARPRARERSRWPSATPRGSRPQR